MDNRTAPAFPILKLWRDGRDLSIRRLRNVLRVDVDSLFSSGSVQIVVAQWGAPLLWMQIESAPLFWKRTPKSAYYHTIVSHVQQPDYSVSPGYLFFPSIWESLNGVPVVLLEGVYWPSGVKGAAQGAAVN
jgi:hypothetical protein